MLKKISQLNDATSKYEYLIRHKKYEDAVQFVIDTQIGQ